MNLTNRTTLEKNLGNIEASAARALRSVAAAMQTLNRSYHELWSLPDEELGPLLQKLLDDGKLQELFNKHYTVATSLNAILDSEAYAGERAVAVPGRAFTVTPEGAVELEPLPQPEPEEPTG